MSRRGRLRVGVLPALTQAAPSSGHGRVWRSVLDALGDLVELRVTEPSERRWRQPDVWLADGHGAVPDVHVPLVVQVHEAGWREPETLATLDPRFAELIAARTAAAVSRADAVITPSESARRQVISSFDVAANRVVAVLHGVDSSAFSPRATGGRARVEAALGSDRPYVLAAAVAHPRKNLHLVRDAVQHAVDRGLPHALVLVVSPAADRDDGAELLSALTAPLPGHADRVVRLTADDAQLAGLMSECDVFCLPSLSEGFGLPVLEAMACGAAVLVSDRGALPEVVGDGGRVVDASGSAVSDALLELLHDPDERRRLGAAARIRAEQLTWTRTARGWADVLERAAGNDFASASA